jgi:hypothetical protein
VRLFSEGDYCCLCDAGVVTRLCEERFAAKKSVKEWWGDLLVICLGGEVGGY